MFKLLMRNTVSNVFFRVLIMALNFFIIPVMVSTVGEESYGIFLLASSIMGYFALMSLGLPGAVTKYVAQYNAEKNEEMVKSVINTTFYIFVGVGLLVAISVIIFVNIGGIGIFKISEAEIETAKRVLNIAAILAIISWPGMSLENSLRGLQKIHEVNIIKTSATIIDIGGTITSALLGYPLEIIFLFHRAGTVLSYIVSYIYLKRCLGYWRISFSDVKKSTFKVLFGLSVWMLLNQIAGILTYEIDKFVLGVFLPVSMITVYAILVKPFMIIKQVSNLLKSAVLPSVSEAFALEGQKGIDKFIYRASRYHNSMVAPMAVLGAYLSAPFIRLWMGEKYLPYIWVAELACLIQIVWQSNGLIGFVYQGTGKAAKLTLIGFVNSILNLILSVIFVKQYGVEGVILGTVVASFVLPTMQYFIIFPDLSIKKFKYFYTVFIRGNLPAVIIGIAIYPLRDYLFNINDWVSFIVVLGCLTPIFYIINFFIVFEKNDRNKIIGHFLKRSNA